MWLHSLDWREARWMMYQIMRKKTRQMNAIPAYSINLFRSARFIFIKEGIIDLEIDICILYYIVINNIVVFEREE